MAGTLALSRSNFVIGVSALVFPAIVRGSTDLRPQEHVFNLVATLTCVKDFSAAILLTSLVFAKGSEQLLQTALVLTRFTLSAENHNSDTLL